MRRPRRATLSWLLTTAGLTIATLVGNITYNVLADRVSASVGPLTWLIPGVGLIVTGVLAGLELRWRAQDRQTTGEPPPSVPEQPAGVLTDLPFTSGFVGREADVAWIAEALRTEHAVAVLGRRAVGTSACAVQAANAVRAQFPDGQSYLDLRPRGRPLSPYQVLVALTTKLGLPSGETDLARAIRARLADRCVLLVLDNVSHPAQVRGLLPLAPACRLLLAGTPALNIVDELAIRWLSEPDPGDAVALFAAAADAAPSLRARRPDPLTDPAVPELVELCGYQPRVVRALGWQLARHGWRSDELLKTLRHAVIAPPQQHVPYAPVLDLLCTRDVPYAALSRSARRLFRLLSLTSAGSPVQLASSAEPLARDAIGALTRYSPAKVDRLLDELAGGAFVVAATGDRYRPRPLLAGYARLHLRRDEPARRRIRAQARLVRHLARRAAALASAGSEAAGHDDPDAWFELHQDLLRGNATGDFRLALALSTWYARRDELDEWAGVCRAVLATQPAKPVAGWAHNELGVIARRRGDPHAAAVELTLAVAHRRRRGAAQSRTNLGLAMLDQGEVDAAIEHLDWARRHRSPADRAGQALTHLGLGAAHLARGEVATARQHLVRAANRFDALDDRRGYAAALTNLALAHWRLGERLDATLAATTAVVEYDKGSDADGRGAALLNAGAVLLGGARPRAEEAHHLLSKGVRLRAKRSPSPGLGRTLLYLGDAAQALGRPEEARGHWADAVDVCEETGDAEGVAAAERRLA